MSLSAAVELGWLPEPPADWTQRLRALAASPRAADFGAVARQLAGFNLSFTQVNALDRVIGSRPTDAPPFGRPYRLAVLATSTVAHLAPALRVAAVRRGLSLRLYEPAYGQAVQEIIDPTAGFHAFAPQSVLLMTDAASAAAPVRTAMSPGDAETVLVRCLAEQRDLWSRLRDVAHVIQATVMPRLPTLGGENDHRIPHSGAAFIERYNSALRAAADTDGVDLLSIDRHVAATGLAAWHSASAWHSAKQEIALPAAPLFGDLAVRLIATRLGLSAKCCVFDLDNTLWGGVAGDDGPAGVVIGQGSAAGEAFLAVQSYALDLRRRGVLLAVCSKNDTSIAESIFTERADMLLKREHFSCFVANWTDKAENLRRIAATLNIGLDSLVFVDDNPFERNLVREAVPDVMVPEVPDDPALVPASLAASGYFELVTLTDDDLRRAALYEDNAKRAELMAEATDLKGYLAGLDMVLHWSQFQAGDLPRIAQLMNKTNQFNLTTRRLGDAAVATYATSDDRFGLQFRLKDRFGDNGLIAVMTGRHNGEVVEIDDWLMSCRVIGRHVEAAMLHVMSAIASTRGASRLDAMFRPTPKNAMVADLLDRLGFATETIPDGTQRGHLDLAAPPPSVPFIRLEPTLR